MKKFVKVLAVLTVVMSIYSCGTSNEFSTAKRKYNKGYYLSFKDKVSKPDVNNLESQPEVKKENKVSFEVIAKKVTSSNANNKLVDINNSYPLSASANNNEKNNSKTFGDNKNRPAIITKVALRKVNKTISKIEKNSNKKSSADIDDQTILLIILSLFPILALIAIFIKDGKSVTLNFWIDLLLHFVFLYWLFALLVVLDVINLA